MKKNAAIAALFMVQNYSGNGFFYSVNVELRGGALLRRPSRTAG
jgi:hypothetical protein